jgi:hypothetical protein
MLYARYKDHPEFYRHHELNTTSAVLKLQNVIAKGFQGGAAAYWQSLPSLLTHLPRALLPTKIKASLDFLSALGDGINSRVEHRNGTQSHHKLLTFLLFRQRAQGGSPSTSQHALCSYSSKTIASPSTLFLPPLDQHATLAARRCSAKACSTETPPLTIRSTSHKRSSATCSSSPCFRTIKQPAALAPTSNRPQKPNVRPLPLTNSYFLQSTHNISLHC